MSRCPFSRWGSVLRLTGRTRLPPRLDSAKAFFDVVTQESSSLRPSAARKAQILREIRSGELFVSPEGSSSTDASWLGAKASAASADSSGSSWICSTSAPPTVKRKFTKAASVTFAMLSMRAPCVPPSPCFLPPEGTIAVPESGTISYPASPVTEEKTAPFSGIPWKQSLPTFAWVWDGGPLGLSPLSTCSL